MSHTQKQRSEKGEFTKGEKVKESTPFRSASPHSHAEPDDRRVTCALEEYLAALEEGQKLDRQEFLARHAEIVEPLAKCLDGLEFIRVVAPQIHEPATEPAGAISGSLMEEYATTPLGDFRIVRELGRGGMGVVYEAIQLSLGRRVALKVLPFAATLDAKQLQRFKNEAQAAAHMQHTNIVPVYYVGCERGVHFYAMQYIEGQTLAKVIADLRLQMADLTKRANSRDEQLPQPATADGPAPPVLQSPIGNLQSASSLTTTSPPLDVTPPVAALTTECSTRSPAFFGTVANLGVQAAEALEHAHQLGIIHRDIKPANLLVDAGGRLWITDFGLAHCQSQPGLTMTGDVVGTLRYMSPEQALAKQVAADARTDVYSLGVTLYELLTLEPAYNGRDREELLRQIAFEEPRPPRRSNRAIPAELETVVLKAMAKSPEERYNGAQELADDLRRFLEDKPIRARRPSMRQRAARWARRYKPVVRAAVAVFVLAVVALAVSTILIQRANSGLSESLERERQLREEEQQNAYHQRIALAEREWSANNLGGVEQLLDACPADLRGWEWHYLKRLRLQNIPPLRHPAAVLSAVFSPDGRWIASGSHDGEVTVWDATTGEKRFSFPAHESLVWNVAFSPDGRLLATASWDKTVKLWGFDTPRAEGALPLIHTLPHPARVHRVAFSPDSQRLASAGDDKTVRLWDVASGRQILFASGHTHGIWCVAYSADGQYLASASEDTTVKIWDASTGREMRTLRGHSQPVYCVTFSRDGKQLASATTDFNSMAEGEMKVWDAQTGMQTLRLRGHVGWVTSVAFSPDGRRLASAGVDCNVKLWDLTTGHEVLTLRGHSVMVHSLAFSRDGNRLVSASGDSVRIWNATPLEGEARQEVLTLRGHDGGVRSVAFSPDGRHLASAGDDATVRFWDFRRGLAGDPNPLVQTLSGGKAMHLNVAFSKDGQLLASGGGGGRLGGQLKVWDVSTWKELTIPNAGPPVAFSPDGQHLAAASANFTIEIWEIRDAASGRSIQPLTGHRWAIHALVFSPDPGFARLASASGDRTVRIWDVTAGKEIVRHPVFGASTVALGASPLGVGSFFAATALTAGRFQMVALLRHTYDVRCLAFSQDGRRLASGSGDRTVRVWDARTWQMVDELPDPTGRVRSVAFHPKDHRVLAWGGTDSTVKVWNGATKEIRTLNGHTSWVESVAFSPDGEWIASASLDGTVKLWQAPFVAEARAPAAAAPDLAPKGEND